MTHDKKVTCFLPCRQGSERVPRKNIKPFGEYQHGLIEVKLNQLLQSNCIDEVVLSTNDSDILAYASTINSPKLRVHERASALSSSQTSTDDLVAHALELIPTGHILWTHVTSPFIGSNLYDDVIAQYFEALTKGFDSLMTVTPIHGFLWQNNKPMNYDRSKEKWPRTQTLTPVHEVNSGVFLAPTDIYRNQNDRIGQKPYLYELDKLVSHDIDWPEDFVLAECMLKEKLVSV